MTPLSCGNNIVNSCAEGKLLTKCRFILKFSRKYVKLQNKIKVFLRIISVIQNIP